jgi:hypothetical protein
MLNHEFGVWSHECNLFDQAAIVLNIFYSFKNECFKTVSENCQKYTHLFFATIQAIQKVAPI